MDFQHPHTNQGSHTNQPVTPNRKAAGANSPVSLAKTVSSRCREACLRKNKMKIEDSIIHVCMCKHRHSYARTCARTHMYTHMRAHTHEHTHVHTCVHTHTHVHITMCTHIHTQRKKEEKSYYGRETGGVNRFQGEGVTKETPGARTEPSALFSCIHPSIILSLLNQEACLRMDLEEGE